MTVAATSFAIARTRRGRTRPLAMVALFALVALFFGAAIAVLPAVFVLALAGTLVGLPIYIFRPVWLIVPAVVFQMYTPWQPSGDIFTGLVIFRSMLTLAQDWGYFSKALRDPLFKSLLFVGVCVVVSFAFAAVLFRNGKPAIYQDGRVFFYWLWILPLLAWAPHHNPENWVVNLLLGIALIVSCLVIIQGVTGITLVGGGKVAQLETLGQNAAGVNRVQIPGFIFVTFGIIAVTTRWVASRKKFFANFIYPFFLALLFSALVLNFGRAVWIWTIVGLLIAAGCLGLKAFAKLILLGTIVAVIGGAALTFVKPQLAQAVADRASSITKEGGGQTSYGWREVENSYAARTLGRTNLLGVGLGGEYRPPSIGLVLFENHVRYIHNGHLFLILKISVVGYLSYLILWVNLIWRSVKMQNFDGRSEISAAMLAWLLIFVGENITQPEIMTAQGVTLVATLVSLLLLNRVRESTAQPNHSGRI